MTKYPPKNFYIISAIIIISGLAIFIIQLYLSRVNIPRDNSIERLTEAFEREGFEVKLKDYPKSRSEIFSYSELPAILLVDDEEIFIFQYNSQQRVTSNLKLTNDSDEKLTYYSDFNIFLYRGDNEIITKLLKSKLNTLGEKRY